MSKFPKHRHTSHKSEPKKIWSRPWFARWHWRLGLLFVPLVLWLLFTGVLLQYAGRLGLDQQPVRSVLLLNWYGIPEAQMRAYPIHHHWLSSVERQWYFDHIPIAAPEDELLTALAFNDMIIGVGREQLLLLDAQGALIETISKVSLPAPIVGAEVSGTQLRLHTEQGDYLSEDLLSWTPAETTPQTESAMAVMPVLLQQAVQEDWRARQLNWERVLQDLHSGRMFGVVGELLSDLAALGLLFLSLSGVWMWWKRRNGNGRPANGKR